MQTIATARDFLRAELCQGARRASELAAAAEVSGLSSRTLRRARKELGVVSFREGPSPTAPWLWRLGGSVAPSPSGDVPDVPGVLGRQGEALLDRLGALEKRVDVLCELLLKVIDRLGLRSPHGRFPMA